MNYEGIIWTIKKECHNRKISYYQLSKISAVPISTIYGIFNHKNKAQVDTLYQILTVLDLDLSITPKTSEENNEEEGLEDDRSWLKELQCLPEDKKAVLRTLTEYLKE